MYALAATTTAHPAVPSMATTNSFSFSRNLAREFINPMPVPMPMPKAVIRIPNPVEPAFSEY